MERLSSLSIFFPAYNDAPALPALIGRAFLQASRITDDFEVIVVNDGSCDNTTEVLAQLAEHFGNRLRVVRHLVNRGYGGALRSGFEAAAKEFVFYTDGDGQYDLDDLPAVATRMEPGIGLVNGYKTSRQDVWYRVILGTLYLVVIRHVFWLKIHDVDCDFRLVRRAVLQDVQLTSSGGAICVELVRKIQQTGCGIVEVPVRHLPRLHGKSQFFRLSNLYRLVVDVAGLFISLMILRNDGRACEVYSTERVK